MKDALGVANYFVPTAHDAGNLPLGTALPEGNLRMWSPEEEAALTRQEIVNGRVEPATAAETTPARNGLTDEQAAFMAQIRRTRAAKMLPDLHAIDKLIEIVEELTHGYHPPQNKGSTPPGSSGGASSKANL